MSGPHARLQQQLLRTCRQFACISLQKVYLLNMYPDRYDNLTGFLLHEKFITMTAVECLIK